MTRVLVVDDSQFMRTVLGSALTTAGYEVETASDGAEAVDAVADYDPDVVTMDVEMPTVGGIEAVERIMATNPTVILMLSVHTERGAEATLDALERGAAGFLHKPDGSDSRNVAHLAEEVVEAVDELADANVSSVALARTTAHATRHNARATRAERSNGRIAAGSAVSTSGSETVTGSAVSLDAPPRPGSRIETGSTETDADPITVTDDHAEDPVVVVGASTGGPRIVERLFERLPPELGAKVLVVQHMPAGFTGRFAARLDSLSEYDVREAADGDRIEAGEAAVAPGDSHLEVANNVGGALRLRLDDGDRRHGVRPAIDVTMETVAETASDPLCGVVLTGMGRDGAAGIEAISDAGGRAIAQDEATSPVFGIPCQAIRTGRVDDVVPAGRIADAIVDAFRTDGENDD